MRKLLLGTTALAAAVAFAAPALAQTGKSSNGIDVTVGGYNEFFFGVYDNDLDNGTHREFEIETEVDVRADGVAENGLTYGAEVQIRNDADGASSSNIGVDESWVYVGGSWGQLRGGDFDGAEDELAVFYPSIGGVDGLDGDYNDFLPYGIRTDDSLRAPTDSDSTKVMYITPSFSGFQAAINYTPEFGDAGQDIVFDKDSSLYHDWVAGGVSYNNNFGAFKVEASVTGSTAQASDDEDLKDFFGWAAGLRVGYAGFTVGGGYSNYDDFGRVKGVDYQDDDQGTWNVGVSYANGPFAANVYYEDSDQIVGADGNVDYQAVGVGALYNIAPGLVVSGDLVYFDADFDASNVGGVASDSPDGYVAVVSTAVSF